MTTFRGTIYRVTLAAAALLAGNPHPAGAAEGEPADQIYVGGTIVTVNDAAPTAEALAVRAGKVTAVGPRADVMKAKGERTEVIDLAGKTVVPGFLDGHSHFGGYLGIWGYADLNPPPVGDVDSIPKLQAKLRRYAADNKVPPGQAIVGTSYDDSLLAERRHPTAAELDAVSTDHPVVLLHISGHIAAANRAALKKVGFVKGAADPKGGTILRDPATGEPTGVVEEQAVFVIMLALLPKRTPEQAMAAMGEIQRYYASFGVTTAQEGQTTAGAIPLLRKLAADDKLILDVVAYPKWTDYQDVLDGKRTLENVDYHPPGQSANPGYAQRPELLKDAAAAAPQPPDLSQKGRVKAGVYEGRLKLAGIKITGDGSPQGKTAYLTKPYVVPPKGQPPTYRGYPVVPQPELDRWFDAAYRHDVQILIHCNGDASADMAIAAIRKAQAAHGKKDLRPVIVHAQTVRADQVDAMAELGVTPSFFTAHTFFWGDWHRTETLGEDRAAFISPMRYAIDKGLRPANHTDAPVVPPDQLLTMHTAVNRTSRSGVVVGPGQRVTPLEALKAVTIWSARMYFEDDHKGSLEPGKLADLVVLSDNPLTVPPDRIKDVKVVQTVKEGKVIYARP